jgi:hypothetical protein
MLSVVQMTMDAILEQPQEEVNTTEQPIRVKRHRVTPAPVPKPTRILLSREVKEYVLKDFALFLAGKIIGEFLEK